LDGIADLTMQATQFALDGLAQRGDARANNIANVLTPGFRSSGVSFESALSTALGRGAVPDTSRITTFAAAASGRASSAPANPTRLPPIRTATITTAGDRSTACFMTLGTIT